MWWGSGDEDRKEERSGGEGRGGGYIVPSRGASSLAIYISIHM
jgi:hypothetical protein